MLSQAEVAVRYPDRGPNRSHVKEAALMFGRKPSRFLEHRLCFRVYGCDVEQPGSTRIVADFGAMAVDFQRSVHGWELLDVLHEERQHNWAKVIGVVVVKFPCPIRFHAKPIEEARAFGRRD